MGYLQPRLQQDHLLWEMDKWRNGHIMNERISEGTDMWRNGHVKERTYYFIMKERISEIRTSEGTFKWMNEHIMKELISEGTEYYEGTDKWSNGHIMKE